MRCGLYFHVNLNSNNASVPIPYLVPRWVITVRMTVYLGRVDSLNIRTNCNRVASIVSLETWSNKCRLMKPWAPSSLKSEEAGIFGRKVEAVREDSIINKHIVEQSKTIMTAAVSCSSRKCWLFVHTWPRHNTPADTYVSILKYKSRRGVSEF